MNQAMEGFKDEFRVECLEHLQKVEENLLLLEKQNDDPDMEMITEVFRSIHSIKGAAGFMGYSKIAELSHVMETLLQMMRKKDIRPETKFVDTLLSGNDILRSMIDDPDTSNHVEIDSILSIFSEMISSAGTSESKKMIDTSLHLKDTEGRDIGFSVSEFNLNNLCRDYAHLCLLEYDLKQLEANEGIRPLGLIRELLKKGAIVDTKIETGAVSFDQDFDELPLKCLILYATSLKPDQIERHSGLEKNGIIEVCTDIRTAPVAPASKPEIHADLSTKTDPHTEIAESVIPEPKTKPHAEPPSGAPPPDTSEDAVYHGKMASHSDTVRVRVDILDRLMKLAGELVLVRNNLLVMTEKHETFQRISQRMNVVTTELQETIMQTRMQPMDNLFAKLPRVVRELSKKLSRQIEIKTIGKEVELDKTILEALTDPMTHLIRNCCDHGIETADIRKRSGKPAVGRIEVHAYHEAGLINIRIRDDGRGINPEIIRKKAIKSAFKTKEELARMNSKEIISLIMLPGFSTAEKVSEVSGRGVGMDVVKACVEKIGGSVEIDSALGKNTCVHLRLPLTLAIIPCLIVRSGGTRYAIPQINIKELICLYNEEICTKIECAGDQEVFRLRKHLLPMARLNEVLARTEPFSEETRSGIAEKYAEMAQKTMDDGTFKGQTLNFVVLKMGSKFYGLVIDEIIGVEEVVVNPIHIALKPLKCYTGTTIMGNGSVALILDVEGIAEHAAVRFNIQEEELREKLKVREDVQAVLLFKNGPYEQFAVPLPMISRVEHIRSSSIEKVGDREFVSIDNIPTQIVRLDSYLNVSPGVESDEKLLLLPKHIRRPFGILVSEVIDTADTDIRLNEDNYMEEGLLGTAMIRGHMTLFVDFYRLIEIAEPDWFDERRKKAPRPETQKRILLAEDTPFFRNLVAGYLSAEGYEVTSAENGKQAFEALNESTFDIIVSDLDMPLMDGWTFMEYVREESKAPNIPAIALTALDSDADRASASAAGFDAYQVKLDREALLLNVSELLQ